MARAGDLDGAGERLTRLIGVYEAVIDQLQELRSDFEP
jgi:hypothetical protein